MLQLINLAVDSEFACAQLLQAAYHRLLLLLLAFSDVDRALETPYATALLLSLRGARTVVLRSHAIAGMDIFLASFISIRGRARVERKSQQLDHSLESFPG